MKKWKDNVYFVLVEPKEPGNIGASARAIKNMGFSNLCLVRPPAVMTDEVRWLACNALDILESAKTYDSVKDAIRDKSLVIGTTRRTGKRRGLIFPAEQGTRNLFETARSNKIAILFGREDRGLYNEEVEECGFLITIPSSKEQPSLNLSQAVMIIAYELSKAEYPKQDSGTKAQKSKSNKALLIDNEELAALYERISRTLRLLEYIPRGDRDLEKKIMSNLKHFIGRAGLTEWELKMLHGICTQIQKKIED